jgi:hypothetical protein
MKMAQSRTYRFGPLLIVLTFLTASTTKSDLAASFSIEEVTSYPVSRQNSVRLLFQQHKRLPFTGDLR